MVCSLPDTRGQGSSFSPPNSGKFWFSFKQRLSKKHYIWPLYLKTLTHYISVNLVLRMAAFSCDLTQFDCGREASVCLKTMKTFLFFLHFPFDHTMLLLNAVIFKAGSPPSYLFIHKPSSFWNQCLFFHCMYLRWGEWEVGDVSDQTGSP